MTDSLKKIILDRDFYMHFSKESAICLWKSEKSEKIRKNY